jgi:uncharacterized protein (DUF885 family)
MIRACARHVCLVLILTLAGCARLAALHGTTPGARLAAVIDDYTKSVERLDPYWAHYHHVEESLDEFGDYPSPQYFARVRRLYETTLARVSTIDPTALVPRDARTYRLFREDVETSLAGLAFPNELLEFNQQGNRAMRFMEDANPALTFFPFDSVAHYEAFLGRAQGFPAYVERQIALFRRAIAAGVVHNCAIVDKIVSTYAAALEPEPERNPFWRPVTVMPATFANEDRARLAAGFRRAIVDDLVPGYRTLDRFLRDEYRPHCRETFGFGALPRGADWYAERIRAATDLPLSARDVHERGLREVARIRREMDAIRKEVRFHGSLTAFLRAWATAPGQHFTDAAALVAAFADVKATVAPLLPRWFADVPKTDYEIVHATNPESPAASYLAPTDNVPRGRLVLNTKNLGAVARDRVPTLSLHEAIPGHHFQLALQFEMKDRLSEYQRRIFSSAAFAEGWALYAERLGREMGVYRTPMERLGNLNDEMLRAVRLVVDSGIHAYGWSEARAIAYMRRNLAHDARDIAVEVSRYAVWPGQALAYKIGELEILDLRRTAEAELGPAFDVREFHAAVLGNGTVSLGVLRSQVRDWIALRRTPVD